MKFLTRVAALALIAVAPLVASSPARAQATQWGKSGSWVVLKMPAQACAIGGDFGEDHSLLIVYLMVDGTARVSITSATLPFKVGDAPAIMWTLSFPTESAAGAVTAATPPKTYSDGSNDVVDDRGTKMLRGAVPRAFLSDFAAAKSFTIGDGAGKPIDGYNLEGTAGAIAELRRCGRELFAQDIGSGKPAATKAVLTNPTSIVTDDDYPPSSLRAEEQGRVQYALTVSAHGQLVDCAVTASSGFPTLDAQTCALFQRRARFKAATDAEGKPTRDVIRSGVSWRIPQ